jgi:plasmid stabilization system protein ParE
MTRFTVIWSNEALNQLAQIWLAAVDRPAVNAAAAAIDGQLANDPQSKGTALSEGLRALDVPPLHALFAVAEPDRLVHVVFVRSSNSLLPPIADGNGQAKS